jgi:hypothetical protein
MKVRLDFNIEDAKSGFDPLPGGVYPARVGEAELKTASTGKPMIEVIWEVTEGEFAGRKVWDNIVTSVQFKIKQYADLAGIASGAELDTNDLVGTEALLTLIQQEYEGEPRNKIKKIEPLS